MAVQLLIEDGSPYYWNSGAIWAVPGSDPLGAPAVPVVGGQAYLWARVRNTGETDVSQAKVSFWIANPSLSLRKSTARLIGSAFADVTAGGSQDVLCLVPWTVELVNNGHECIIAEASSSYDPLAPAPADPDLIYPATYRQVAQRNLNVLLVSPFMSQHLTIGVHAGARAGRQAWAEIRHGGELDRTQLEQLGVRARRPAAKPAIHASLSLEPCGREKRKVDERVQIEIPAGRSVALHLDVQAKDRLNPEEYHLITVVEHSGDRVLGGITFVVTSAEDA